MSGKRWQRPPVRTEASPAHLGVGPSRRAARRKLALLIAVLCVIAGSTMLATAAPERQPVRPMLPKHGEPRRAAESPRPPAAQRVPAGPPIGSKLTADPREGEAIAAVQARAERLRKERQRPENQESRRRSRRAFAGLSRDEALTLGEAKHPGATQAVDTPLQALPNGMRLDRFLGDHSALVRSATGGRPAMLESEIPLRSDDESGHDEPVDLRLAEQGGALQPKNPLTDIKVDEHAADIEFDDLDVTVRTAGAPVSGGPALNDGAAFWGNVEKDTDLSVLSTPRGAETYHLLRSEESPEHFSVAFDMPPGATLREQADGVPAPGEKGATSAEIVDANGDRLLGVSAPTSIDADGMPVDTRLRVVGDQITIDVDHRGHDYRYPIAVDPLYDSYQNWKQNTGIDFGAWSWRPTSNPMGGGMNWGAWENQGTVGSPTWLTTAGDGYLGYGLYLWNRSPNYAAPYQAREWIYRTPKGAWLQSFELAWVRHDNWGQGNSCMVIGVYAPTRGAADTGSWSDPTNGQGGTTPMVRCGGYPATGWGQINTSLSSPTPGNYAVFKTEPQGGPGVTNVTMYTGGAWLVLNDNTPPSFPDDVANMPNSSTWVDQRALEVHGRDNGLGISHLDVGAPTKPSWSGRYGWDPNCAVGQRTRCPEEGWISTYVNDLPEGNDVPVDWNARDVLGTSSSRRFYVDVDHTAPTWVYGGDMATRNGWVNGSPHTLTVAPRDPYSGVRSNEITLNRTQGGTSAEDAFDRTQAGGWGSAPTGGPWTLVAGDWSNFSATAGRGRIVQPPDYGTQGAILGDAKARDVDYSGTITFPNVVPQRPAEPGGDYTGNDPDPEPNTPPPDWQAALLTARSQGYGSLNAYHVGVAVDSDGRVRLRAMRGDTILPIGDVDTGITFTPGDTFGLRVQITGASPTTIRARAWRAGTTEPTAWTLSTTDTSGPQTTGSVGVRTDSSSIDPAVMAFDNLKAVNTGSDGLRDYVDFGCGPSPGCPQAPATRTFRWDPSDYTEGTYTARIATTDALGHAATDAIPQRLDKTRPTVATTNARADTWIKDSTYSFTTDVTDGGSGAQRVDVYARDQRIATVNRPCTAANGCPTGTWNAPLDVDTSSYPEGPLVLRADVYDAVGNMNSVSWVVKIDRTPPSPPVVSGPLWDHRGQQADHRDEGLYDSSYPVHATATDARSGVGSIEVFVDGVSQRPRGGYVAQASPGDGAPLDLDWTLRPDDYADGTHTVEIAATDRVPDGDAVRHRSSTTFTVTSDRRGNIYRATESDAQPSPANAGADIDSTEWTRYGSTEARSDDDYSVSLRRPHSCPSNSTATACDEVTHRLVDPEDGTRTSEDDYATTVGSRDDPNLEPVSDIAGRAQSGTPIDSGPIGAALAPWQHAPPAHGTRYEVFEQREQQQDEDGAPVTVRTRVWVENSQKFPLKLTIDLSDGTRGETTYFDYSVERATDAEAPEHLFDESGPTNPASQETEEHNGTSTPNKTDSETGAAIVPMWLGTSPVISGVFSIGMGDVALCQTSNERFLSDVAEPRYLPRSTDAPDEAPDPSGPITAINAIYDARPGATCVPGSGGGDDPWLEISSYARASTVGAAWLDAYRRTVAELASRPDRSDAGRAGTQTVTVGGAPTTAYIVPDGDGGIAVGAATSSTVYTVKGHFDRGQVGGIFSQMETMP